MNILTLCYEFPPLGGGGGKVVQGLTKELSSNGYTIDLLTMHYKGLTKLEKRDGVNIYRIPCIRKSESVCRTHEMASYIASALPAVLRLTSRKKYDLNHTHFIFPDGLISYLIKKHTGLPYIITAHGSDVPAYNPDRFRTLHKILNPIWNQIVNNSEFIICPSETLKSLIKKKNQNTLATVIANGIKVKKFSPETKKENRILVVTRMLQRKGVQYVIKALRDINHSYEVNIVGDGPYLNTLREIASSERVNVNFCGWLENESKELKELYETSRIFILPSESENFPIVLLEAMAAGAAIITTKGTGCAEVVGDSAILVHPRNELEIRTAIKGLIENPNNCIYLGKKARKRVEDNFSWEAVAGQYSKIFELYDSSKSFS